MKTLDVEECLREGGGKRTPTRQDARGRDDGEKRGQWGKKGTKKKNSREGGKKSHSQPGVSLRVCVVRPGCGRVLGCEGTDRRNEERFSLSQLGCACVCSPLLQSFFQNRLKKKKKKSTVRPKCQTWIKSRANNNFSEQTSSN